MNKAIGQIPRPNFGFNFGDLVNLDRSQQRAVFEILYNKPSKKCISKTCGSWSLALADSGVIKGGNRNTRGFECWADDGHYCRSIGEKIIDDWLHENGIKHTREPKYPEGKFRADFEIDGKFIEYCGMAGNPEYDSKIEIKKSIALKHNIELVCLESKHIVNTNALTEALKYL